MRTLELKNKPTVVIFVGVNRLSSLRKHHSGTLIDVQSSFLKCKENTRDEVKNQTMEA